MVKVRLLRNKRRLGLIRSRQHGADVAQGEILVFLDGHTECSEGWIQPLLQQIMADWKVVIQPTIGLIDPFTFDNRDGSFNPYAQSTFSWDLR